MSPSEGQHPNDEPPAMKVRITKPGEDGDTDDMFEFTYQIDSVETILETFERYAENPELNFNWAHAVMGTDMIRGQIQKILNLPNKEQTLKLVNAKFSKFFAKMTEENKR